MRSAVFRRPRFEIKPPEQLRLMRSAGLVVAQALAATAQAARPGVTTGDLDEVAARVIADAGAEPSFLGYGGFPAHVCISVNEEVIHGIPGPRVLREGDVVSIDCGAIVRAPDGSVPPGWHGDGWHGDAAVTVLVGERRDPADARLSDVTRQALFAGIAAAQVGARVGDIGHAIATSVRSAEPGYGIVAGYTGHGIGSALHMEPNIPNTGRPGRGATLRAGMVIAIEPMITAGGDAVDELNDDWTVVTRSGVRAAHWEHTVAVTPAGPWVLTAFDGGGLSDEEAIQSFE